MQRSQPKAGVVAFAREDLQSRMQQAGKTVLWVNIMIQYPYLFVCVTPKLLTP